MVSTRKPFVSIINNVLAEGAQPFKVHFTNSIESLSEILSSNPNIKLIIVERIQFSNLDIEIINEDNLRELYS